MSAVTLGELQAGVEVTREQDAAKASAIERRVDRIAETSQVLAIDARVCRT